MRVIERVPPPERVTWIELIRAAPDRVLRSVSYVIFGVWAVITTLTTPGFTWLHAVFLLFALAFVAVGVLFAIDGRTGKVRYGPLAHLLTAAMLLTLGCVLLFIAGSPFGLLCTGLGLQALVNARFTRHTRRPAPGAGDGPSGSSTQP